MQLTLDELCRRFGGRVSGDGGIEFCGVAELGGAGASAITFAERLSYRPLVEVSQAAAVVVPENFPELEGKNLLLVENPREVFVGIMELFAAPEPAMSGISPAAWIGEDVRLGASVSVGPGAVLMPGAVVGPRSRIAAGVYVGSGVTIGSDCRLGPNVSLLEGVRLGDRVVVHAGAVIGGDGFGFIWSQGRQRKVPQLGRVEIEDDVELGCNSCVDRATMGVTRIRKGAKIDNLVQIGHNDDIGEHALLAGQVGLAGSVKVGDRAALGGKAGVVDHVAVGEGARLAVASLAIADVAAGEMVWGRPAKPMMQTKREILNLERLPDMRRDIKRLTMEIGLLRRRLEELENSMAGRGEG